MKTVILKQRLNLSFNESFAEDESQEQVRYFLDCRFLTNYHLQCLVPERYASCEKNRNL